MKSTRIASAHTKANGFTIVELIVIIVVIVILASIVLVSYRTITQNSATETAMADAQVAAAAINKYKAENGTFPTNLSQVTISKTQSTFAYQTNSSSYCVSALFNEQFANVVAGNSSANEGECAALPPVSTLQITNIATNPSAEVDLGGVTGFFSGLSSRVGGGAVDGSMSFLATTTGTTNYQGLIQYVNTAVPARTYTCAMSFKGTDGVAIVYAARFLNAAGANLSSGGTGSRTFTISSTSWTRKTIKVTAPANSASISIQYRVSTPAAGVSIQADALMCTEGSTDYNYADGDAAGWTWTGARHQSASTGPSTGVAPAN